MRLLYIKVITFLALFDIENQAYFYDLNGLELEFVEFQFDSGITNLNAKYDLTHYVNDKVKLKYGLNSIYYEFDPGQISPTTDDSPITADALTKKYAFENGLYIDGEFSISEKLNVNAGLRLSTFNRLGLDQ